MFLNIRNILTVVCCALLACGNCYSQFFPIGSKSSSMGRSSVAITDIWGNNPACLAFIVDPAIGCYYESRFLLKELSLKALGGTYPTPYGGFGFSYVHIGFELYSNQNISLKYAKLFKEKISVGVHLDYIIAATGNNYGTYSGITFGIGFQLKINNDISLAANVYNPVGSRLGNERINSYYRAGMIWHISKELYTTVAVEKNNIHTPLIIRGGVMYSIKDRYYFRTGFSTTNVFFSFGVGIEIGKLNLNISSIYHNSLGFSPQAGLSYTF